MDKNWIGARRLVWVNLFSAVLLVITFIAGSAVDSCVFVFGSGSLVLWFAGLIVPNLIEVFRLWKPYRRWAFFPLTTYLCCTVTIFGGTYLGISAVLAGTPQRPGSFPRGKVKSELEQIATELFGHSFKHISTRADGGSVEMVAGIASETMPADLVNRIRACGFDGAFIDDSQSLVVFSSVHHRSWYRYLYSPAKLQPAYFRQSTITRTDIESWGELRKIARQGPEVHGDEGSHIAFSPSVVYSTLSQALGPDLMTDVKANDFRITAEHKDLVLQALNDQRRASSRLVEHCCITYNDSERFHLSIGCPVSDSFWVTRLLQTLMSKAIILRAEDKQHLLIKKHLTEPEERQVEWLHVGLMNFLYGNLLEKRDHHYTMDLGDGWYFERD